MFQEAKPEVNDKSCGLDLSGLVINLTGLVEKEII
jgi:hypothetical protein